MPYLLILTTLERKCRQEQSGEATYREEDGSTAKKSESEEPVKTLPEQLFLTLEDAVPKSSTGAAEDTAVGISTNIRGNNAVDDPDEDRSVEAALIEQKASKLIAASATVDADDA